MDTLLKTRVLALLKKQITEIGKEFPGHYKSVDESLEFIQELIYHDSLPDGERQLALHMSEGGKQSLFILKEMFKELHGLAIQLHDLTMLLLEGAENEKQD